MTHPARGQRTTGATPRSRRRTVKAGIRGACAAFALTLLLVPALPAGAAATDPAEIGRIGNVHTPQGLSLPLTLLFFVGFPLLGFIIGGAMAFRPQRGASRRYRPGRPWTHEPVWFGDESALEHEPKRAALPGAGGASGRW